MSDEIEVNDPLDKDKTRDLSGQPSYIGFEYQILATVWVALESITTGKAEAIIVEPPESLEDVEVNLNVPKDEADSGVQIGQVEIQMKFRSSPVWQARDLDALLAPTMKKGMSGPQPRIRPLEFLKTQTSRQYLLLTNAQIQPSLNSFAVSSIGQQSNATRIPYVKEEQPELAQRIGVLYGKTEEILQLSIETILLRKCHVPGDQLLSCINGLKEDVRERLKGKLAGRFTKVEIFNRIRMFGGKFVQPSEPVYPNNYGKMVRRLQTKSVLILIGPPGTGKTTLAESIVAKLEQQDPPCKRIFVSGASGIPLVRQLLKEPDNHVFYFEDPWGTHTPTPDASAFTSELPKLMADAHAGKVFIVTSRIGVFKLSVGSGISEFEPFTAELTEKNYGNEEYTEIYNRQINEWPIDYQKPARYWQDEALKHILTPLAVHTFCSALRQKLEKGEAITGTNIKEMADTGNVNNVSRVLNDMLVAQGNNGISAAVAIWAKLAVSGRKVNAQDAREFRVHLKKGGFQTPPDIERLFNQLADAGWLQPRETGYDAHPCVYEALAQLEINFPGLFQDTIDALFHAWVLVESMNNVLLCVKESKGHQNIVPDDLAESFDAYLISVARSAKDSKFIYAYNDIEKLSKTDHPVSVLTRVFDCWEEEEPAARGRYSYNRRKWAKPNLAANVVKDIRDHAEWFAKQFVTDYLPHEAHYSFHGYYYEPDDLLLFLGQFGWPIKEWFKMSFEIMVKQLDDSTAFMAECLCKLDNSSIDTVFNSCLKEYQDVLDCPSNFDQEQYHKEEQGEIDASPCGCYEDDGEYLSRAQSFLTTAMRIKRARDGYVWIQTHIFAQHLLDSWADILEDINPVAEEYNAFVITCEQCGDINAGLTVMRKHPDPRFSDWIINRLLECNVSISGRLIDVLKKYSLQPDFLRLLKDKIIALNLLSRIQVGWYIVQEDEEFFDVLSAVLPYDERRILFSCYDVSLSNKKQKGIQAKSEDLPKIKELVEGCSDIPSIYLLEVTKYLGVDITDKLDRFLRSGDREARECAWRLCEDRSEMLTHGTVDPEYRCRVAVLSNLAQSATFDERQQLINLSNDPSAYVREAIARCIGINQWSEGISALLVLIRDHRECGDQQHENDYWIYSVARAACNSLNMFQTLSGETLDAIRNFLIDCTTASVDSDVHGRLFRILSKYPSEETMRFCSLYIKELWLKSQWRKYNGRDLLVQCLHTIIQILVINPDLHKYLDFSNIEGLSARNNDESELVGSALVLLGLTAISETSKIDKLAKADLLSAVRAHILLSLSESLQKNRPQVVMQHIPPRDPFITLLDWATTKNRQTPYDEFSAANPSVSEWLKSLKKTEGMVAYERWAIKHLIDPSGTLPEFSSVDLPHPYGFKES